MGLLTIYSILCVLGLAILGFLMAACGPASAAELEDDAEQNSMRAYQK